MNNIFKNEKLWCDLHKCPAYRIGKGCKADEKCGIENVIMLTGDSNSAAEILAEQLFCSAFFEKN